MVIVVGRPPPTVSPAIGRGTMPAATLTLNDAIAANGAFSSDGIVTKTSEAPTVPTMNRHATNGVPPPSTSTKHLAGATIPLNEDPAYKPRKLRVITIGAGYSGLILAHKLQHRYPEMQDIVAHTIFEARADIGGTWLVNNYPGVRCDVPSHIYAFPFDPNPNWSNFYSTGPEIHEYMQGIVKKWDLDRDVEFNTRVTGCWWQEQLGKWKIKVEHEGVEREEYAEILISGQGFLNIWKWPDIPGLHDFKGCLVHSANWDHEYDYSHKRIALIGNGSSGIQILPQIAKLEGTDVTSFQRGPTWVIARMSPGSLLGKSDVSSNPEYTEEEKKKFREDPVFHNKYRKQLIHRINKAFRMFVKESPENKDSTAFATKQMSEKLNQDPELCEKLIPKWELGCRRITPGEGYLESFLRPNVHLTQSSITRISENAVHTADGKTHEVDVVACATGFDVSHCPHYPIIGRKNTDLARKWADEPESYMSLACPSMPNYFIFTGPNAVVGHGSLMEGLSWAADYMIKWFKKIATEDIESVVPKQEVVDEFVAYGDQIHKTLTWTGGCRSWYKKNRVDGRVTATFAGSALLFRRLISDIRGEDFEIRYRSRNRWRFMGNGFTEYELGDGNDLAWYIEK